MDAHITAEYFIIEKDPLIINLTLILTPNIIKIHIICKLYSIIATPKLIKKARLTMGYTQKEAAALIHVSLRAWQLWKDAASGLGTLRH
jgi:hypothetical protein